MATLPRTELETHPDGTIGAAGIVNSNWTRLDNIFNPALSSGDASFPVFWQAVVRSSTDPTVAGSSIEWDVSASKPSWLPGYASTTHATSLTLDLLDGKIQEIDVTGTTNFQSLSGQQPGQKAVIMLEADGSGPHTLTFPAGWRFVEAVPPAAIAASKVAILEIWSSGTTDATVVCRYSEEP